MVYHVNCDGFVANYVAVIRSFDNTKQQMSINQSVNRKCGSAGTKFGAGVSTYRLSLLSSPAWTVRTAFT